MIIIDEMIWRAIKKVDFPRLKCYTDNRPDG
jgi:hypothetical protein